MSMHHAMLDSLPLPSPSQIADLRLAASNMTGPTRRAFEAEMTLKYCGGHPLMAEAVFGWGRQTVALGLAERRTGIMCLGAQSACSGRKRWEERQPQVAEALRQLADVQAQQDPTFRTSDYTRRWRSRLGSAQSMGIVRSSAQFIGLCSSVKPQW